MDVLKNFSDKMKGVGDDEFLCLLQSNKKLEKFMRALNFYDFGRNYGDVLIKAVSSFACQSPERIKRYFDGDQYDLTSI